MKNIIREGQEYGYLGDIFLVDQLCSPDKSKVSLDTNTINDIEAAVRFGTQDIKEYSFWSRRSCGIAVLFSILKTFKSYLGTIYDLVKKADNANGYIHKGDLGWKHQAIVDILMEYSFKSSIVKHITAEGIVQEVIKGNIFICSVMSRNEGSHMVLVYKVMMNKDATHISILDTWNFDDKGGLVEMTVTEFDNIFLGRGILVKLNK